MEITEFVSNVSGFDKMADRDKIRHFAWYLHTHTGIESFATGDVRRCFDTLHLTVPNVSLHLKRMAEAKQPCLICSKDKYKLHRRHILELDNLYAERPATIAASRLLADLPAVVPNLAERAFLHEAIVCYRAKAYRAAIVMTWNLTYDHLVHWIFAEPNRVSNLNAAFSKRFTKNPPTVAAPEDIESIKEFDVVEACGTAKLMPSNMTKILKEKLTKRNMAAHPSSVIVEEAQANDVITDLVKNILLTLK